jgi:hypothetical protein
LVRLYPRAHRSYRPYLDPRTLVTDVHGFLPALIGGIHGINGFRAWLPWRRELEMNDHLGQLLDAVKHPDPDENFLKLAKLTYDTLTTRTSCGLRMQLS